MCWLPNKKKTKLLFISRSVYIIVSIRHTVTPDIPVIAISFHTHRIIQQRNLGMFRLYLLMLWRYVFVHFLSVSKGIRFIRMKTKNHILPNAL